ncbi:hypothetical protein [Naasia aerilata]|uniref:Ferrous iron transport protein A n=1 Tax=Naasia aerilata TaxID=1162966 RepID=A0ABM8G7X2_9MICO|nr:hypothetical protein [Naasia aerilata]BDZ44276.1 hypothetical protein GCM10025866_01850 [Naasia aerilata]
MRVTSTAVEPDGAYRLEVACDRAAFPNRRALRALGWRLLGEVAEAGSCVLEAPLEDGVELRMLTGMPPRTTDFATHGHTMILAIRAERRHEAGASA